MLRNDIQALRGIAVLAVVAFHADQNLFKLGNLGVDVFFVVSGYVVTPLILKILDEEQESGSFLLATRKFYIRRFFRLAPALGSVIIFSGIFIFLTITPENHEKIWKQGIASIFIIGNFSASHLSGDYFHPQPNPLIHTWSLSVEEQFYVLYPIIIIILIKYFKSYKSKILIISSIIALSLFSFFSLKLIEFISKDIPMMVNTLFGFYSTFGRIWEFAVGGLISIANKVVIKVENKNQLKLLNMMGLIIFLPINFDYQLESIFAVLFTSVILRFRSLDMLPIDTMKTLTWIGNRSYSIYLVHMPLLYIAKYSSLFSLPNQGTRAIPTSIAVCLTFLIANINYHAIEQKWRVKNDNEITKIRTLKTFMYSPLIPLVFLLVLLSGTYNHYWGFDKNINRPPYAGDVDKKCARDSKSGPPCLYNFNSNNNVLLLGDSHAASLSQVVIDVARENHWNAIIWTHSGCNIQFRSADTSNDSKTCLRANLRMKKWLLKNKVNLIIVSQYVRTNASMVHLKEGIIELQKINRNLLIMENNPVFKERDFLEPRPVIFSPPHYADYVPLEELDGENKKVSDAFVNWADQNSLQIMKIFQLFCNENNCRRKLGNQWLYRDNNHLSIYGANLIFPLLDNYLRRLQV